MGNIAQDNTTPTATVPKKTDAPIASKKVTPRHLPPHKAKRNSRGTAINPGRIITQA